MLKNILQYELSNTEVHDTTSYALLMAISIIYIGILHDKKQPNPQVQNDYYTTTNKKKN